MEILRQDILKLERLIDLEVSVYEQYIELIAEERKHTVHFNATKLAELTAKRGELIDVMHQFQEQRRSMLKAWSGTSRTKLSTFVKEYFAPEEAKRILPKVERLRELVTKCRETSDQFNQVVRFSLNVVSGLISILWSATQNVLRSYTPNGKMKESYHPARSRSAGVLKQA